METLVILCLPTFRNENGGDTPEVRVTDWDESEFYIISRLEKNVGFRVLYYYSYKASFFLKFLLPKLPDGFSSLALL